MKKSLRLMLPVLAVLGLAGSAMAIEQILGIPPAGSDQNVAWTDKRPVLTADSVKFGAYDPHGDFRSERRASIEHLFLPWEDVDLSSLQLADNYARERGRTVLISVEPWSWSTDWRLSSQQLLANIKAGRYDGNIAQVCQAIGQMQSPVMIRWGQEMEDPRSSFSWANWPAEDFKAAFRDFVTKCRVHVPRAQFVWSPLGLEGLQAYYPGDDVVDLVGLSVFGYQPYDRAEFGRERSFAEALRPGYERVAAFGKPIFVTELGYEGDNNYVRSWAQDVARRHAEFPRLQGVVYFNDREVYDWPRGMGRPNWRVARDLTN